MTKKQWKKSRELKRKKIYSKGYKFKSDTWSWEHVKNVSGPYISSYKEHIMYFIIEFNDNSVKRLEKEIDNVYEDVQGLLFGTRKELIKGREYFNKTEYHNNIYKQAKASFDNIKDAYSSFIRNKK